jgi:hypothetical protein
MSHIKAEPPDVAEDGQKQQEQKLVPQKQQAAAGDILSRQSSITVAGTCQQLPGASALRIRRMSVSQSRSSENARSCIADTSWDEVVNMFLCFIVAKYIEVQVAE